MIRMMMKEDLQQCGEIYAKAFPIEYWGIGILIMLESI